MARRLQKLSLNPYPGSLFVAHSKGSYERAYRTKIDGAGDKLTDHHGGSCACVCDDETGWTYVVWADGPANMVHELSHVALHVFDWCGIDPRDADGEPFCYFLAHLFSQASGES